MLLALLLTAAGPSETSLQAAFRAAHHDYLAQIDDSFSEPTADPKTIGEEFKLVINIYDGQAHEPSFSDAYFTYESGKLRLIFSPSEAPFGSELGSPRYLVGEIGGRVRSRYGYLGANAFGASAKVTAKRVEVDVLAMLDRPEGEVSPYTSVYSSLPNSLRPTVQLPRDKYWIELIISGSEARKLAADAGLLIEGTIGALAGDKLNHCKGFYAGATIETPNEVYGQRCWVGARVSKIAFIRRSTGEILKEWDAGTVGR